MARGRDATARHRASWARLRRDLDVAAVGHGREALDLHVLPGLAVVGGAEQAHAQRQRSTASGSAGLIVMAWPSSMPSAVVSLTILLLRCGSSASWIRPALQSCPGLAAVGAAHHAVDLERGVDLVRLLRVLREAHHARGERALAVRADRRDRAACASSRRRPRCDRRRSARRRRSICFGSRLSTMNDQTCCLVGEVGALEGGAAIGAAPHAVVGAGEHDLRIVGMHEDRVGLDAVEHVLPLAAPLPAAARGTRRPCRCGRACRNSRRRRHRCSNRQAWRTSVSSSWRPSGTRPGPSAGRPARRDRRDQLVVVPRTLGLGGLLDLEEVHVVHLAAVGADVALAEHRVVPLGRLQLRHHLVGIVGAGRLDGVQVGERRGIEAGLHLGRHLALELLGEALGEGAGLVVEVPVEGLGQAQPLGALEAERVHVGDEDQQAGELLAALDDAELGRLLDRVDGVAAGIGEPDDLRLRGLRLQQEGGEVRGVDRVP